MNRTSWVGHPNSTYLFKVVAILWQRVADQYRAEGKSQAVKIRSLADLHRDQVLSQAQREAAALRGLDPQATPAAALPLIVQGTTLLLLWRHYETRAEPGAAVPPVDGGGAVRLMQAAPTSMAAPAATHAAATRAAELEGRRIGEGDVGMSAD